MPDFRSRIKMKLGGIRVLTGGDVTVMIWKEERDVLLLL
jgi:hypothetical protein